MSRIVLYCLAVALMMAAVSAAAQDRPIRVAVKPLPPYAEVTSDGAWFGLAVDAWRLIAESEDWDYALIDAGERGALDLLRAGEADVALPVTATPERSAEFRLTPPIHVATIGITENSQNVVAGVVSGMMSWAFLRLVLWLSVLLLVVGAIVWLLERRGNGEQFNRGALRGLGDGFWWAGVTLTTIGYGDKAPVTLPGRAVAMLWMLVGLAVSASLTAAIVALTGVQSSDSAASLDDLRGQEIAVAAESGTARYLASRGMTLSQHEDLDSAVAAFAGATDVRIAAVAAPAPALRSALSDSEAAATMVRDTGHAPSFITFATSDPAADELIAPAVLDLMTREAGWRLVDDYIDSRGGA